MDPRRLVDVRAGTETAARSAGSGYLISDNLVVTARHVVFDGNEPWAKIGVWVGHPRLALARHYWTRVTWTSGELDIVLLAIVDGPAGLSDVRFGAPITGRIHDYTGMGYPEFAEYNESARSIEQLSGALNPLSTGPNGYYVLDQRAFPNARSGGRLWSGVSGSAVFVEQLLVGIVVEDDQAFDNRRLHAIPIQLLLESPGFVEILERASGARPVLEPIELHTVLDARLKRAVPGTPGSLLAPAVEAVQFHGRSQTLESLIEWRDSEVPFSIRLVTAQGGYGKTRLAREFVRSSQSLHWIAGFTSIARQDPGAVLGFDMAALVSSHRPLLLVFDYSETYPAFIESLVEELAKRSPISSIRLLLLARTTGSWWKSLEKLSSPGHCSHSSLTPVADSHDSRALSYSAALASFGRFLGRLNALAPPPNTTWERLGIELAATSSAPTDSDNVLTLHMAALVELLRNGYGYQSEVNHASVEDELVMHERFYMRQVAAKRKLLEINVLSTLTDRNDRELDAIRALDRALAGTILLGPCDDQLAVKIASLADAEHSADVLGWLKDLYPGATGDATTVGQVQPDRLAEFLLGEIVVDELQRPTLLREIGKLSNSFNSSYQALFALIRTSAHLAFEDRVTQTTAGLIADDHAQFVRPALILGASTDRPGILLQGMVELARRDPLLLERYIGDLMMPVPDRSATMDYFLLELTKFITKVYDTVNREFPYLYIPSWAGSLSNVAVRLADLGKPAEAIPYAKQSLLFWRAIRDGSPKKYILEMVGALVNLGRAALLSSGEEELAREAFEEAVSLARTAPKEQLRVRALAIANRAAVYQRLGLSDETLVDYREAIETYQEVVRSEESYRDELAEALTGYGYALLSQSRDKEGLSAIEDALIIWRDLARGNPDSYLSSLGKAANILAHHIVERVGDYRAAVGPMKEAAYAFSELTKVDPHRYLIQYEVAAGSLGGLLLELGSPIEAVEPLTVSFLLAQRRRDEQSIGWLAFQLSRCHIAYPAEVDDEFRAISGISMPDWIKSYVQNSGGGER